MCNEIVANYASNVSTVLCFKCAAAAVYGRERQTLTNEPRTNNFFFNFKVFNRFGFDWLRSFRTLQSDKRRLSEENEVASHSTVSE